MKAKSTNIYVEDHDMYIDIMSSSEMSSLTISE